MGLETVKAKDSDPRACTSAQRGGLRVNQEQGTGCCPDGTALGQAKMVLDCGGAREKGLGLNS